VLRWHGDLDPRRAVYANRARLLSGAARVALVLRAVLCERAFAHVLDRGGMRRTWLRGRANVAKRYLVHIAAHNLGLVMRALVGAGTPRATADVARQGRSPPAPPARRQIHQPGPARHHHRHARRSAFINGLLAELNASAGKLLRNRNIAANADLTSEPTNILPHFRRNFLLDEAFRAMI
jgi:hypothetical protein